MKQNSMRKSFLIVLLICAFLADAQAAGSAQRGARLRGTVTDSAGGVVVAAHISLTNSSGEASSIQTDELGRYTFSTLAAGEYQLQVSAEGFGRFNHEIKLAVGEDRALQVVLDVVLEDKMEVKSTSSAVSTDPDQNLSAITLAGESLSALPDDPDEMADTLKQMAGTGGNQEEGGIYVNGFREGGRLPRKSAIQMIRINANPFSAEFSEPGQGRIEIITKPGTSQYHGDARFTFNNQFFNARNAFAERRTPQTLANYSGSLGGPIIRNRLGFFADFERRSQDDDAVVAATVIDQANRPRPFSASVPVPSRLIDYSARLDYLLARKHTAGLAYHHTSNDLQNQGLQSGFDLPDRAFNIAIRDDTLRLSFASILTEHIVNDARLELSRRSVQTEAINSAPALIVLDAFNAGANQEALFSRRANSNLQFSDSLSVAHKQHTFKVGGRVEATRLSTVSRSNFGGTFTFGADVERDATGLPVVDAQRRVIPITPLEHYRRTLQRRAGYFPSQFSIVRGDPFIGFTQWEAGWFIQDDWAITPRLTLSYGLRYEFQNHLGDKLNFAPRVGLAWSPDAKRRSALRWGAGLFNRYIDSSITEDSLRLDGGHQQQIVINQPSFFLAPPDGLGNDPDPAFAAIRTRAPHLNAPYVIISNLSYDRQVGRYLFTSVSYQWQRYVHRLRTRNINAPLPGTPDVRPMPDRGPVLQFESTGLTTRQMFTATVQVRGSRRLSLFGAYNLVYARSDTDGPYAAPANSYDLSAEYGRALLDQRHRLFIGGAVALPAGFQASPFLLLASGLPFNITTGKDNNGDTLFTDRPAFASPEEAGAIITRFGVFNPNPQPGSRIIPHNFSQGPGQATFNFNLSKVFGFGAAEGALPANRRAGPQATGRGRSNPERDEAGGIANNLTAAMSGAKHRYNLMVGVNIQNLLNHTNLAKYNGVLVSPLFGTANRALSARRIEFSTRFSF